VPLADAGDHGLALVPGLVHRPLLPFARGQHAARLALQVQAGRDAKTELAEVAAHAVHTQIDRELVEVGVDRLRDRLLRIHPAMAAGAPVAVDLRTSRQTELPGGNDALVRAAQAKLQAGQGHQRLDGGARLVGALYDTVEQGPVGRITQFRVGATGDATH